MQSPLASPVHRQESSLLSQTSAVSVTAGRIDLKAEGLFLIFKPRTAVVAHSCKDRSHFIGLYM